MQRKDLRTPLKVEAEFMFDLANVLSESEILRDPALRNPGAGSSGQQPPSGPPDPHTLDPALLTQFFIIMHLRATEPGIIEHLRLRAYFDPRYEEIINKLKSGYYDQNVTSERIVRSFKSELAQLVAHKRIGQTLEYLKIAFAYCFLYFASALYLFLFRMRSIIAITSKGTRLQQKQAREKSSVAQFVFGVIASIVATAVYDFFVKVVL